MNKGGKQEKLQRRIKMIPVEKEEIYTVEDYYNTSNDERMELIKGGIL